ncbi:MAG: zinc-dependent metalloprotease [Saprospiraceae bacterium]
MQIKKILVFLFSFLNFFTSENFPCYGQRCSVNSINQSTHTNTPASIYLQTRNTYSFRLVFHILYLNPEEKISSAQVNSQIEILNEFFSSSTTNEDLNIPKGFRSLKANPGFQFCLADIDPNGNPTTGIHWFPINNLSVACQMQFGKRSIMHKTLGGVDIWDPKKYINIYIVNRDQCNALGEAIFPWDATTEEDGIILDYRTIGTIGTASNNQPFHQGKTLVHEMGHYFGLLHLSGDRSNCNGEDSVADTPSQSLEYFGCPEYPQWSCNSESMFMNFMSLVDDPCMQFFTKLQVTRMRTIIARDRSDLLNHSCSIKPVIPLDKIRVTELDGFWQLINLEHNSWSAHFELYDISGKLIWLDSEENIISKTIPGINMLLNPGIYFLNIYNKTSKNCFKLLKN